MNVTFPSPFPPRRLGAWRNLSPAQRREWLARARERAHAPGRERAWVRERRVHLDGRSIDDRLGFYCAIGEAVNGPGGYFGRRLEGLDDCLFGGYGLERPYTIVWQYAEHSRRSLGSAALIDMLEAEYDESLDAHPDPEALVRWREQTIAAARSGTRTLFDTIVEGIRSVPTRGAAWPPGYEILELRDQA